MKTFALLVVLALAPLGCAHSSSAVLLSPEALQAIVSAPDRSEEDRALDPGRKPVEFLEFLQLAPGMKVAELMAGGGYTAELLARAVGPKGVVYGQNPKWLLERVAEKPWAARLAKPVNQRIRRSDKPFENPFPPNVTGLDLVVSNFIYHDTVNAKVDRAQMNLAVRAALKHGGRYVICDSSAKPGSGLEATETLHRIDEQVVRSEVAAAGFEVLEEGNFLRNPEDPRDWSTSPGVAGARRGTGDRFCLDFKNP